ncbi:translation initiation factor 2B subunit I family protein [Coprinopsis marcescibilis]|uniref:Methylthioribose-1-phosphate isomerase n=1 Tax=Coprinopsis marcescibilis TaxID=230819 RepID=A0A5C3L1E1_COPMA|nr:translation initiation factor 2B subunit I family protein [Coprinopsis marcescibilis]
MHVITPATTAPTVSDPNPIVTATTMTAPLISIRTNDDNIEIVDQLLLPHITEFIPINSVEEAHDAIKTMKIRGAPAIASLASLSLAQYLTRALRQVPAPEFLLSGPAIQAHVQPILDYLLTSRPTAVNLGNATKRLAKTLEVSIAAGQDPTTIVQTLIADAKLIADEDVGRNKAMAKWGGDWLVNRVKPSSKNTINVLTVCNTGSLATSGYGTALGLITYLHEIGQLNKAHFTQTTPYHQGSRLTALELKTLQIPSVMICDTMVGSLFQHYDIHAVVVGADRIARNGDTANKIGTYNAAVIAARHKIPVIVVAPITTVDLEIESGAQIPIEQRPAIEACLVRGAVYPPSESGKVEQAQVLITPTGLEGIYNPSFDVTPAELITAIVTEKGVAVKKEGETVFDLSPIV